MSNRVIPAPEHWTANGRTYAVRPLAPAAVQELEQLIRRTAPDPLDRVKRVVEGMPPDLAKHVWDQQTRDLPPWPPEMGSQEATMTLLSPEGQAITIYHATRKHHPEMTREKAAELAESIDPEDFLELLRLIRVEGDGGSAHPTAAPAGVGPAGASASATSRSEASCA